MKWYLALFMAAAVITLNLLQANPLMLKDNLRLAEPGDYLVLSCGKTLTLMHIYGKTPQVMTIEEIAIPERKQQKTGNWKDWVAQYAPGNSSWVMYEIDLNTGQMGHYYSFTKQNWFQIPDSDNFISKLLNLKLTKIPDRMRKKVGSNRSSGPEMRPLWHPRMIVEGKPVEGVEFDAWKTDWPRDGSDLSNKTIEVYLPSANQGYPAYFPYWLQINGVAGKAKIRIIDSGKNLHSPMPSLSTLLQATGT